MCYTSQFIIQEHFINSCVDIHDLNEIDSLISMVFGNWEASSKKWGVHLFFNSLRPHMWCIYISVNKPSFDKVMACYLAIAKPLSEPILEYCYVDPWEQVSMKS